MNLSKEDAKLVAYTLRQNARDLEYRLMSDPKLCDSGSDGLRAEIRDRINRCRDVAREVLEAAK